MKNIFAVMKKDLDKIFKFPRMIFSTIILPGLMIFLVYSLMGTSLNSVIEEAEARQSIIYIENTPALFEQIVTSEELHEDTNIDFQTEKGKSRESLREAVLNGEIDAVILFDNNFDNKLNRYLENQENEKPTIEVLYDISSSNSNRAYNQLITLVAMYKDLTIESLLSEQGLTSDIFTLNQDNVADEEGIGGQILAGLLPMLIIIFIFSGSLGFGADAIAGEKERGTLSTLLMAPISKNNIIIGKLLSTSITSVLAAVSSFVGVLASMPFAKNMFYQGDLSLSYNITDYLGLLVIFVLVAFMASSLILVASTIGRNVKEATNYAMPLLIVAMIVAVVSTFAETIPTTTLPYLIPLYNASLGLKGIFSFQLTLTQFLLIVSSSIVFIGLISFVLVRLFNSEKILFSK